MNFHELYFLSTYLKKWSFMDNRITLNYSFTMDDKYERSHADMRLGAPVNMVNELLNNVFHTAKEILNQRSAEAGEEESNNSNIILVNESEVKRKLTVFVGKILKEFNNNRRSHGRQRMISTRSLDFYYNDFEYEPLDEKIKFFVHLNRGMNKINGELWPNAVDDFALALEFRPDDKTANKYMALALTKLGRYKDALKHIRLYANAENSQESLEDLASAYIHLHEFQNAEEVYNKLEELFPDSLVAQFGKAQLAYKKGKGYKTILDRIYKNDPVWFLEKMKKSWDYTLPGYGEDESSMWNAAIAARYLGFERPFDLTRRAFNDEMPSYFDSEKGTIRFVKAELDNWVELNNRYHLDGETYEKHPERLTPAEMEKGKKRKKRKTKAAAKIQPAAEAI